MLEQIGKKVIFDIDSNIEFRPFIGKDFTIDNGNTLFLFNQTYIGNFKYLFDETYDNRSNEVCCSTSEYAISTHV